MRNRKQRNVESLETALTSLEFSFNYCTYSESSRDTGEVQQERSEHVPLCDAARILAYP